MQSNAVGWFEVPVTDMNRPMKFYETVLDVKLDRNQMGPLDMAWFPMTDESYGSTGSLVCHPKFYKPSTEGIIIYFTAQSGDLNNELSRIEDAGGKVLQPKTRISDEYGFMALIIDSEGNRVALHSRG
ncbi:VOC family protein [Draconibacterium halophilum]|uniref:VOC family protein n=1 Tax=Draconibacterium halophilum TaxID=2706887 RepID=A0A6C0RE79_9BACT|nr:VOC family protein [Draconibacterium halophilum]QIA08670.1 VOC family protein [Draconibacterium halophilum]